MLPILTELYDDVPGHLVILPKGKFGYPKLGQSNTMALWMGCREHLPLSQSVVQPALVDGKLFDASKILKVAIFFSPDLVNARVRSIRLLVTDRNSINLGTQANHQLGQLSNLLGLPKYDHRPAILKMHLQWTHKTDQTVKSDADEVEITMMKKYHKFFFRSHN